MSEGKDAQHRVKPDYRVAVVIHIVLEFTVPIHHVAVIQLIEMWCIITNAKKHAKKVGRFRVQRIVHVFAVVEKLEDVGGRTIRIVAAVDVKQHKAKSYLNQIYGAKMQA
jgi:hypothetical protein